MNPNLFVWTSDWHLGRITKATAQAAATFIASLDPAGVIDTGDCSDGFGAATSTQHDDYVTVTAPLSPSRLPGNHDEFWDYKDVGGVTDFTDYDAKVDQPPYRFTRDWDAPKIRFIGIHSYIHHSQDSYAGWAHVDSSEAESLDGHLASLPEGWQAIVCSHFPLAPAFGNYIHYIDQTYTYASPHPLLTTIAAHKERVAAYLNGHRHANMNTALIDTIRHFNGPGIAYTEGNGYGGFVPIDYDPAARTLTFRYLRARAPFAAYPGYTPVVIQLPPLPPDEPPPDPNSYPFAGTAVLGGSGPLAGSDVTLEGTLTVGIA